MTCIPNSSGGRAADVPQRPDRLPQQTVNARFDIISLSYLIENKIIQDMARALRRVFGSSIFRFGDPSLCRSGIDFRLVLE